MCVCVCVCAPDFVSICTHSQASVSLCICVCRGHVYKKSSTRCHTQLYKCRFNRNNSDLPRLSGSACRRASSSHPSSLNSYFTLICIFFTAAKSFIRGDSSSNFNIYVQRWAACNASWEGSPWSFRQSDEEQEAEE